MTLQPLLRAEIMLAPPQQLGAAPLGRRRIIPSEVLARLAAGEAVDPSLYYMRTTPSFETGAANYVWLNRLVCVATGERRKDSVALDVYEVK